MWLSWVDEIRRDTGFWRGCEFEEGLEDVAADGSTEVHEDMLDFLLLFEIIVQAVAANQGG